MKSTSSTGVRITRTSTLKDPSKYTDGDKELKHLDTSLQLIIVETTETDMSHQILSCVSAKEMWETIEQLMEGTEEVKENMLDIVSSQCEAFKSFLEENLSPVFERYTKLLSEIKLQGKTYPIREINRKFMLTLPYYLEHRSTSIRDELILQLLPLMPYMVN